MIGQLTATAIIKVLLMTITIGAKVPAGLFIPSLALGSCIGRAFGMAVEAIIACVLVRATYARRRRGGLALTATRPAPHAS